MQFFISRVIYVPKIIKCNKDARVILNIAVLLGQTQRNVIKIYYFICIILM